MFKHYDNDMTDFIPFDSLILVNPFPLIFSIRSFQPKTRPRATTDVRGGLEKMYKIDNLTGRVQFYDKRQGTIDFSNDYLSPINNGLKYN